MCDYEGYVHRSPGSYRGQRHRINPLGTVLQVVGSHLMWVLVIKFWFSARSESTLSGQATALANLCQFDSATGYPHRFDLHILSFSSLFSSIPSPICSLCPLHPDKLGVSVLIIIYCKQKPLWRTHSAMGIMINY